MGTKPARQASRTRTQRIRQAKRRRMAARMKYRNHLAAMKATNKVPASAHSATHHEPSALSNAVDASQTAAAAKTTRTKKAAKAKETKEQRPPRNPITRQWRRFKETKFYQVWNKRPKFSYGAYTVVFVAMVIFNAMFVWWSMQNELQFDPKASENLLQQVCGNSYHALSEGSSLLNMIALVFVYLICITLINRFWVGTALFGTIVMIFSVATKIKVKMRGEPIIPSDLGFITGGGGGAGEVTSFITDESRPLVQSAVQWVILFVVVCIVLQFLDRRRGFIHCSWRHPIASVKNVFGNICRIVAPIVSISLLMGYADILGNPQAPQYKTLTEIGYSPRLWDVQNDAHHNGALITFLSLTRVKVMDEESSYSEAKMKEIAAKYSQTADQINQTRTANLTDSTVIMILSETFSDPNRVPGVQFDVDPMPNIRSLKGTTTSGLMLSPGYGGGTANIEFQQMTGLSLVNFNPTLLSPYQQLVPNRSKFYSFNQIWNQNCGGTNVYSTDCSVGYHPFQQYFYMRGSNYKKFGFSHFYTLDSKPAIKHGTKYVGANGETTNVSDEEAYKNVIDSVKENTKANKPSQYIQLITMQNHAPYPNVYGPNNEFYAANKSEGLTDGERETINNFAKGIQRTDTATADFLAQLDEIDKPITVVFYGDHLPGIYDTANSKSENAITLHETDYFIWSNKASASHDTKLPESDAAYTSSNYFMTQAAEQMNARISPYLALLDELHKEIPAISRNSTSDGTWSASEQATYLNSEGQQIDPNTLSDKAKELLADYKMVQYDMSAGKNYLMDMGFMDVPKQ